MASTSKFQFSVLISLLLVLFFWSVEGKLPQSCKKYECPTYNVVEAGNGYEIRKYDSPVWISTPPIQNKSFVGATRNGFIRLFNYAHGKNKENKQIKLTAPVTSEVSFNGGKPSIVVSFFVALENQKNPALADGLSVKRWKSKFVAVKQFGGFLTDSNVGRIVASLNASLGGTKPSFASSKSFIIAQYDPPFKLFDRVNEVWLFNYAHGKNKENKQIKLTAPVTSEVSFNGGKPSIVVSFFVALENQKNPALADGLSVKRWKSKFVAVKQFGGFLTDSNVGRIVASLNASLGGTKPSFASSKSFIIAQYDPPFKLFDRVNEVWFLSE
ncbi:uncharacterized protein LOC124832650 [Vigna umbellata]|uniref:uncharacterized protein LOC124832650 n=1 Tax=Vigna umbellata TaxID=87088 RepID=UPI001F5E51CA|nr:uncharacterized protein LOC124832650 [Vigna umbellata]